MKKILLVAIFTIPFAVRAQVGIGVSSPDSSAALDITSTNKGLLAPRLTTAQRTAISNPASGLVIYNTTDDQQQVNTGTPGTPIWTPTTIVVSGTAPINVSGDVISLSDGGVNTVKIADANVTLAKISDGSITTAKILDGSVASVDIADNAITTPKIADGSATTAKIADNAVTSAKILDNTILNNDLTSGTGGIYKGSGSLGGNTIVTQGTNTLAFTTSAINGFSIGGSTFSIDGTNNRIGIGTASPATSTALDVSATNKGFLLPRIGLSSSTDTSAISSPATGLLLYNTNSAGVIPNNVIPGLTINVGTPSSPSWSTFQAFSNSGGFTTNKLRYLGNVDNTKTVIVDNFFEFRVDKSSSNILLQVRLLAVPTGSITYKYARASYTNTLGGSGYDASITLSNNTSWVTFDTLPIPTVAPISDTLGVHGLFSSFSRDRLHQIILSFYDGEFVNCAINTY